MNATHTAPDLAPAPALQPGLGMLIERGILSRAQLDTAAFVAAVERAVSRGEVTPTQAGTLGQMLGVRAEA